MRFLRPAFAVALVLAACGDDGNTTETSNATPATTVDMTTTMGPGGTTADDTTGTPTASDPTTGADDTTGPDATATSSDDTTTAVGPLSFAVDVWEPIFAPKCSCHQNGPSGGLQMGTDATMALAAMVNVKSSTALDYIEPGDPQNSYVWRKLTNTHAEVGGLGVQMPQVGGPLGQDELDTIMNWIAQGAMP